jgi:hypothetical protein
MIKLINISLLVNLQRIQAEIYQYFGVSKEQLLILAGISFYSDLKQGKGVIKSDLNRLINNTKETQTTANLYSTLKVGGFISVVKVGDKLVKSHEVKLTAKGQQVINYFNESAEKYARILELQKVVYRKKIKPKTGRPAHPVICQGCIESFPPDQVRYIVNGFYCGECATEAGESGE